METTLQFNWIWMSPIQSKCNNSPLHIRAFYSAPKMGGWVGASMAKRKFETLENPRKVSPYELSVWFWILSRSCSFSTMLNNLLCMYGPRKKVLLPYYWQYCNVCKFPSMSIKCSGHLVTVVGTVEHPPAHPCAFVYVHLYLCICSCVCVFV